MKRLGTKNRLKGTRKRRNKWRGRIKVRGVEIDLGSFLTEEEAHKAYCDAAIEHFGKYARFK